MFVAFSQRVGAEARDAVGVCAAGGEEEEGSESGDAEGEEGLHFCWVDDVCVLCLEALRGREFRIF